MPCGWVGKILDVDLSAGSIAVRDTMAYAPDTIGGRAMASRIAWDEIPAGIGAYDAENRVIVATGPLTGTLAPTSGRTIMASLSPRSYPMPWYTHSTLGGWFGAELKYAGFDAIVIHGKAGSPICLEIRDGEAQVAECPGLWGLDARQTQLALKERMGQRTQVLTIGPAGENLVRFATVQHAEENAAGHSGFGAVWGSKHLKAIAVRGTGGVPVADQDALLREVLELGVFKPAPFVAALAVDESRKQRPVCSQACTYDCGVGSFGRAVDGRRSPGWCIGGLTWVTEDYMKHTAYTGGGIEVPPGKNFGLSTEVPLHELCNSLGLDLWFRLVMQPWFIRCRQLGIQQIRGLHIEPDNPAWFEEFMLQLAHREGLGEVFAEDLARAMDELQGELPEELIRLGRTLEFGFGFPAHREGRLWDEEPLPFWVISAMMYASETRDPSIGAHHSSLMLADFLLADPELARRQLGILSEEVWGDADALAPTFENKAPVAIWSQHQHMLIDSLPLCDFAFPQLVRPMRGRKEWRNSEDITGDLELHLRLFAAVTGVELSREELEEVAERAFTLERAMLARAGRGRALEESLAPHFKLPCRSDGTLIDEAGFSRLLDEYYAARGWDLEFGWPKVDLLQRLHLDEAVPEIQARRSMWLIPKGDNHEHGHT
jgi:aldehyde:ferredoxin oxidoreductase